MKREGNLSSGPHQVQVEMPRPNGEYWTITLSPLPLGFSRTIRQQGLVPPQPPSRVARDPQGRALRDREGEVVVLLDKQDQNYLDQLEVYWQRVAALVIVTALRNDKTLGFNADRQAFADATTYADALYQEFAEFGFSDADVAWLCEQSSRLGQLHSSHVQQAERRFFEPSLPT